MKVNAGWESGFKSSLEEDNDNTDFDHCKSTLSVFFSDKIETDSRKSHLLELIRHGILISFYFTSIVNEEERGRESYTFKEVLIARSNFRKFRKLLVILRILISARFLAKTNSRKLILAKNTK